MLMHRNAAADIAIAVVRTLLEISGVILNAHARII